MKPGLLTVIKLLIVLASLPHTLARDARVDVHIKRAYDNLHDQLLCVVETDQTDAKISEIIEISITNFTDPANKFKLASASALQPDLYIEKERIISLQVNGSISRYQAKLDIKLRKDGICILGSYVCEVIFKNLAGNLDRIHASVETRLPDIIRGKLIDYSELVVSAQIKELRNQFTDTEKMLANRTDGIEEDLAQLTDRIESFELATENTKCLTRDKEIAESKLSIENWQDKVEKLNTHTYNLGELVMHMSKQIQILDKKLTDMSSYTNSLEEMIYNMNNHTHDLETRIFDVNHGLETRISDMSHDLETRISDVKNHSYDLETKISDVNHDLETRISDVNHDLETRISDVNNHTYDLEKNICDVNHDLEARISEVNNHTLDLAARISDVNDDLVSWISDVDTITHGLKTEISDMNHGLQARISDVSNHSHVLEASISEVNHGLETRISDVNHDLESRIFDVNHNLQTMISDVNNHTHDLEKKISDVNHNLEARISDVNSHTHDLETRISDVKNHSQGLETRISDVNKYTHGLETKISDVNMYTHGLETRLSDVNKYSHGMEKRISDVNKFTHGLESRISDVKTHAQNLETRISDMDTYHTLEAEERTDLKFEEFKLTYKNHKYYVSRDEFADLDTSYNLCRLIGGYLAEIDSDSEYQAARSFMKSTGLNAVIIAGSNEIMKGTWVFQSTKKPLPILDFGSGEPDNYEGNENCLALYYKIGWRMADFPCSRTRDYGRRFMCEVPILGQPQ